jgi:hypothetical protein
MIIQSSRTTLQAGHVYELRRTTQQQVRAWVGDHPPSAGQAGSTPVDGQAGSTPVDGQVPTVPTTSPARARATAPAVVAGVQAAVSHVTAGMSAAAVRAVAVQASAGRVPGDHGRPDAVSGTGSAVEGRLATIVALIEWLTGQRVQVLDPAELGTSGGTAVDGAGPGSAASAPTAASPAPARTAAGWGLEVTTAETSVEVEATAVAGTASVTTADGRHFEVAVDVRLARAAASTSTSRLLAGDAAVTDPLMLGLSGPATLGTQRTAFDLNGDGADEQVPDAGAGAAYLVVDRNGNGSLDAGELLGPSTGDGFAELAAYDRDGNGWIDEADPVFSQLGLATTPHGTVTSLACGGIGAIGLTRVASPFTFSSGDRTAGVLRSTGIWIGEDGSAGAVQQVDIAT